MTIRLLIQAGGTSPLRVSASGADASTANFGDLLFDGNLPSIRTLMVSTAAIPAVGFDPGSRIRFPPPEAGAFTTVFYSKTFPTPPLFIGLAADSVFLDGQAGISGGICAMFMTCRSDNNADGTTGTFMAADVDRIYFGNMYNVAWVSTAVIFDNPIGGA